MWKSIFLRSVFVVEVNFERIDSWRLYIDSIFSSLEKLFFKGKFGYFIRDKGVILIKN